MFKPRVLVALCAIMAGLSAGVSLAAQEKEKGPAEPAKAQSAPGALETASPAETAKPPEAKPEAKWAPAVTPKPLSKNVQRGLDWLVEHQLPGGAWGQGEESQHMGGGAKLKDAPSVADTCTAALALIRSGSTPAKGPYAGGLLKAVNFVCDEVEKADKESLFVTAQRGTRVQSKLGQYIDTFMASLALSEVQGQMPDQAGNDRAAAALQKVLGKMQKHQRPDGTWEDRGWATTIAQGMAVKGANRAAQAGADVDKKMLQQAEDNSRRAFDPKSKRFSPANSAGVELYAAGSNLGAMADSVNTKTQTEADARAVIASSTASAPAKQAAGETLKQIEQSKSDLAEAQRAVVARLDDKKFIAGFGSNGGEEFLSYMNIGESLVVKGDDAWKAWDKSITENLNRVQNQDGSWTGHHCITGRTFCTAAALLVLMVDRAPVPLAAKMGRR